MTNAARGALAAVALAVTPASGQTIGDAPAPPPAAGPAAIVLEHVEAPGEIALGTMAVRFWAALHLPDAGGSLAGASLVFGDGDAAGTVEMRPLDGSFDSPTEEVVGTVDTYAWVRDGAHEWRLRANAAGGPDEIVGQGAIRVKGRIATPDLVLFDSGGAAHAWIGSGAGGFTPATTFESGPPGFPPLLADADGDRLPDVVWPTANQGVVIWKNRGGGRFEPLRTLPLGAEPVAGAVGDLDGDGKPDLVTATTARTLEIRSGLDDPPVFFTQLTLAPERLAITDLDGDGVPEICVALLGLQDGEAQVWSRDDEAGWLPLGRLESPPGGRGRIQRLVPAPGGSPGLLVLSGDEQEGRLESWGPPADTESKSGTVCRTRYRVPGEPIELVAGRFAEDVPWVLVVREGASSVLYGVRERDGIRRMGFLEGVPGAVGVLDLDGDGDDDLVTGGGDLRLWINVRGEEFREAGESPYLLETSVVALVAGNLDERGS